jgi:uncharacterized protein (DUF1330 family)
MSVYIINNMVIHDREEYDQYVRAFLPIFLKYQGEVVALQDDPAPLEGTWPYSRTVILRMPSAEKTREWYESPEYQAIAAQRWRSTKSNVVILPEFRGSSRGRDAPGAAGQEP